MSCIPFTYSGADAPTIHAFRRVVAERGPNAVRVHPLTAFAVRAVGSAPTVADLLSVPCHVIIGADGYDAEVLDALKAPRWRALVECSRTGSIVVRGADAPHHHRGDAF